tara:strand:- start:478 stop:900 length:423 start_codon:yes stop_codon:yes gene_type:complete
MENNKKYLNRLPKNLKKFNKTKKVEFSIASETNDYKEETINLSTEISRNTSDLRATINQFTEIYLKLEMQYNFLKEYEATVNDKYEEGQRLLEKLYNALEEVGASPLDSELYQDLSRAVDNIGDNEAMNNVLRETEDYIN